VTDEIQQPPKRGRGRPRGSNNGPRIDKPYPGAPADWNSRRVPAAMLDPRTKGLKPKQAAFVEVYCRLSDVTAAAREVGVSSSTAHYWLRENKGVIDAIDAARKKVMVKAAYGLEAFIDELDDGAAFARETGNATALARFRELKGKAHGLLVEKIDQRVSSGLQIRIAGIDDEPPAAPVISAPIDAEFSVVQLAETYSKVFEK
jgi:hypothetical protein